jgi:hypothetical protein
MLHIKEEAGRFALAWCDRVVYVNGCQHLWHDTIEELEVALWSNNLVIEGSHVVTRLERDTRHLERCFMIDALPF